MLPRPPQTPLPHLLLLPGLRCPARSAPRTAADSEVRSAEEADAAAAGGGRHSWRSGWGRQRALVREQFFCPISSEIMRDLVVIASGKAMFPLLRFPFLPPSLLRNLGNM
ncbi:hypothetical protein QYE76_052609 [Lolium multiflorum]|uniref:Uncharacterized protein n=1 Tax=Lolium multiflorum TaxID=4521 RepID=A0AAD8WLQ6_LOLMU|nr:hypothetical protein QYE76_052609 [Lolium multiflorum]